MPVAYATTSNGDFFDTVVVLKFENLLGHLVMYYTLGQITLLSIKSLEFVT